MLRQGDCKFTASLDYIARPCLKQSKIKQMPTVPVATVKMIKQFQLMKCQKIERCVLAQGIVWAL